MQQETKKIQTLHKWEYKHRTKTGILIADVLNKIGELEKGRTVV